MMKEPTMRSVQEKLFKEKFKNWKRPDLTKFDSITVDMDYNDQDKVMENQVTQAQYEAREAYRNESRK